MLNFLARPRGRGRSDGVPLEVTAEEWGRVVVGTHRRYDAIDAQTI